MGRASILGIDALIIVVEPGSRSLETAANIANMAKELWTYSEECLHTKFIV